MSEAESKDPAHRDNRALLARALRFEPDEVACRACLLELDAYVAAQLGGDDYTSQFPAVADHLDACLECADGYARLYELELAVAERRLPEPASVPAPDLSFARSSSLSDRLRAAVRHAGERLRLQLSADLVALLRPPRVQAAPATRAGVERYSEVLLALEPDAALRREIPLELKAYRDAQHPEACLVEVTVEPVGRSWPKREGMSVALIIAGARREAVTDAWGLAAFENVPLAVLPELVVEIVLESSGP